MKNNIVFRYARTVLPATLRAVEWKLTIEWLTADVSDIVA